MKKAFLVTFTPVIRVIVDVQGDPNDNLDDWEKVAKAASSKAERCSPDWQENIETISEDTEVPYGKIPSDLD